ncbi:hypothetical protein SS50377_23025 [Spironucleus salmonicida]|uniref:Uncharacterized protein n=1 Tax=Spironucleus salmonicida TaxID=348837 RepID=A0A9P8S083_9EUKA|nr:hypothetical protein SS50377_23025 [Spironucleus salmonicida]
MSLKAALYKFFLKQHIIVHKIYNQLIQHQIKKVYIFLMVQYCLNIRNKCQQQLLAFKIIFQYLEQQINYMFQKIEGDCLHSRKKKLQLYLIIFGYQQMMVVLQLVEIMSQTGSLIIKMNFLFSKFRRCKFIQLKWVGNIIFKKNILRKLINPAIIQQLKISYILLNK